jgi:hypothetical protein
LLINLFYGGTSTLFVAPAPPHFQKNSLESMIEADIFAESLDRLSAPFFAAVAVLYKEEQKLKFQTQTR